MGGSSFMRDEAQPEPTPTPPARRWFRLAEEDLAAARVILDSRDVAFRVACFLAQQAAEKALKAGLIALGTEFPKIHDLTELHGRYADDARPAVDGDDLDLIDPWVIDGRYAADLPAVSAIEARAVVDAAGRVLDAIRPTIEREVG